MFVLLLDKIARHAKSEKVQYAILSTHAIMCIENDFGLTAVHTVYSDPLSKSVKIKAESLLTQRDKDDLSRSGLYAEVALRSD